MSAINNALGYQQGATDQATNLMTNMYDQGRADINPYLQAGQSGLQGLQGMNPNINVDYNAINADPMFQFAQSHGDEMMRRSLVGQGGAGLNSSHGANMRSQLGYQNALGYANDMYNRQAGDFDRGQNYNMGLATLGQNSALNSANIGSNYANSLGQMWTGMANAQAGGLMADNALNQQANSDQNAMYAGLAGATLGNLGNITQGADWMKNLGDPNTWWS